jgi:hypothetical protein
MKSTLLASVFALSIVGIGSAAYAQAPESSPSTSMQRDGDKSSGINQKATHADPMTAGSGGSTHGTTTSGRSVGSNDPATDSAGMGSAGAGSSSMSSGTGGSATGNGEAGSSTR